MGDRTWRVLSRGGVGGEGWGRGPGPGGGRERGPSGWAGRGPCHGVANSKGGIRPLSSSSSRVMKDTVLAPARRQWLRYATVRLGEGEGFLPRRGEFEAPIRHAASGSPAPLPEGSPACSLQHADNRSDTPRGIRPPSSSASLRPGRARRKGAAWGPAPPRAPLTPHPPSLSYRATGPAPLLGIPKAGWRETRRERLGSRRACHERGGGEGHEREDIQGRAMRGGARRAMREGRRGS